MKLSVLILSGCVLAGSFAQAESTSTIYRGPALFGGLFKGKDDKKTGSGDASLNVMKCKSCSTPFSDEGWVQFEKLQKCSPERRYLQNDLLKISDDYLKPRADKEGLQFPVACLVHAQRTFTFKVKDKPEDDKPTLWSGYEKPFRSFAKCDGADADPVRGQYMACVTPEYSYPVYNALNDVADCFDINSRKLLPKLWNESGLHINALGGGYDGGVGQLTKSALQEVLSKPYADDERTALDIFKAQAAASGKASCQRLVRFPGAFDAISTEAVNRCTIMSVPDSPVRNLVYMGVFYKLNERFVNSRIANSGMKDKVLALGMAEADMDYFSDVIVTLSFNAGRGTAFALVENFLKARIANEKKLTAKELDFINLTIDKEREERREPKEETEAQREVRIAKLKAVVDKAQDKTLPGFLRLMHGINSDFEADPAKKRIAGAPGYVTFVGERQKKFDKELGEGTCTQSSFLRHK